MKIITTDHYESRFSKRGLKGNFEKAAQRAYALGHVRVNDTWIDAPTWFENTKLGNSIRRENYLVRRLSI